MTEDKPISQAKLIDFIGAALPRLKGASNPMLNELANGIEALIKDIESGTFDIYIDEE